jgi:hypothetical protein
MAGPATIGCSQCRRKLTFVLHGWLRSGNCGTSRGVVEFLEEALALWQQRQKIRLVRADSGFFDDKLLNSGAALPALNCSDPLDAVGQTRCAEG